MWLSDVNRCCSLCANNIPVCPTCYGCRQLNMEYPFTNLLGDLKSVCTSENSGNLLKNMLQQQ